MDQNIQEVLSHFNEYDSRFNRLKYTVQISNNFKVTEEALEKFYEILLQLENSEKIIQNIISNRLKFDVHEIDQEPYVILEQESKISADYS